MHGIGLMLSYNICPSVKCTFKPREPMMRGSGSRRMKSGISSLCHSSKDGVVSADGGTVLIIIGLCVANLIKLRLQDKQTQEKNTKLEKTHTLYVSTEPHTHTHIYIHTNSQLYIYLYTSTHYISDCYISRYRHWIVAYVH